MPEQPTLLRRRTHSAAAGVVIVAAALLVAPAAAQAQTAAEAYERAQSRERDAGALPSPSPDAFRSAARAYEAIAYRYPVSGYSDNALWQAAALLERAYALSALARDRDAATKDLNWLRKEYPHSPFARQAAARIATLTAAPAAPETSAAAAPDMPQQPAVAGSKNPVYLRSITQAPLPRGDRVTIELSAEAAYSGERVTGPDRVFFDFANASTASAVAEKIRAIRSPLIKGVRTGMPGKGVARVVFELVGEPRYSSFPLYDPFRLVVDIESTAEAETTQPPAPATPATAAPQTTAAPTPAAGKAPAAVPPATAKAPEPAMPPPAPPASTQKGDYSLARQLGLRVSRVVIDAGHGGHDPGAQSNGVTEAELVLDVALRLEKLLSQVPGIDVVLTRRTNEFIPLEERTAIANREHADLFLSIHANAHRQAAVRGVETYFLNFAMNDEAEAVAARENATSGQTMGTLPAIVKAIALNNKLTESRELANLLQTALVRRLRTQSSGVKDLGVKQAPFVVLIGAQMPSVLTEIAFLTNRPESGLLKQTGYRQQIAVALKDGVVRYQESLKRATTVAVREREPGQ